MNPLEIKARLIEFQKKVASEKFGINPNDDHDQCIVCGEQVNINDFRDELSRKEWHISQMCQNCQDEVFD